MQPQVRKIFQAVALVAAGAAIGSWAVWDRQPTRGSSADAEWFLKTFQEELQKQEAARLQEQARQLPDNPALLEELHKLRERHREELSTLPAMTPSGSFVNCAQDMQRLNQMMEAEVRLSQYDYEVLLGQRRGPMMRTQEETEIAQHQLSSYQLAVASCR